MKSRLKTREAELYFLIVLGGRDSVSDLGNCLMTACTNKTVLSELSGIKHDRLVYIFTKKKKSFLQDGDTLIIKVTNLYVGRQTGGHRNFNYSGFNRNI